jgi:hypothetical protein
MDERTYNEKADWQSIKAYEMVIKVLKEGKAERGPIDYRLDD